MEVVTERDTVAVAKESARTQAKSTATSRVFSNYELLENILSCLEFGDLVQARQVNSDFEGVTNRSKTLRKALFLEGGDSSQYADQQNNASHSGSLYPAHEVPVEVPNPLLRPGKIRAREQYFKSRPVQWICCTDFSAMQHLQLRRGQSWSKMHISQPPTVLVAIDLDQHLPTGRHGRKVWHGHFQVRNLDGVRLGEIIDAIAEKLDSGSRKNAEAQEDLYGLRGQIGWSTVMRSELDLTWFNAEYLG